MALPTCRRLRYFYTYLAAAELKSGPSGGKKLPPTLIFVDEEEGGIYGVGSSGSGDPSLKAGAHGIHETDLLVLYRIQAEAGDTVSQVKIR
jgi:hypothetical protein